jgi:hypothetical protein
MPDEVPDLPNRSIMEVRHALGIRERWREEAREKAAGKQTPAGRRRARGQQGTPDTPPPTPPATRRRRPH